MKTARLALSILPAWLALCAPPLALAAPRPSLVVVISVDQLTPEEIARLRPWFGYDGFNRFLKKGAEFSQASYRHAGTFTGPGHASVGTGLDPSRHGIVGNAWFDLREKRIVHCVEDRAETVVGVPDGVTVGVPAAASPRRLRTASARERPSSGLPMALGDRVKASFPGSRVVGLGLKDRSVILMAGKDADGAAWFPEGLGRFVTSSYYPSNEVVSTVLAFDEKLPRFFATPACTVWEPLDKGAFFPGLTGDMLSKVVFDPPELFKYKSPIADMGATFPHPLATPRAKIYSPCGDALVLDLARAVIRKMDLGRRSTKEPDLLFLALSSMDYVGHMFGPDSREVADAVMRLDRSLESFFQWLDENVGRRRVLIWLTADHGVAPIPEVEAARPGSSAAGPGSPPARAGSPPAQDGSPPAAGPGSSPAGAGSTSAPDDAAPVGRVDLDLKKEDTGPVRGGGPPRLAIERALAAKHGYELREDEPNRSEGVIAYFVEPCLVLNREVIARRSASVAGGGAAPVAGIGAAPAAETAPAPGARAGSNEATRMTVESLSAEIREMVRAVPGVVEAYTYEEIAKGLPPAVPFADAFARSFDAERTGDVCVVLRSGWIWSNEPKGTTHGQPHPYDARVPLLAWGAGVRAGMSTERVTPLAIATTTAAIFGLDGVGEPDITPLGAVLSGYKRPKRTAASGHRP